MINDARKIYQSAIEACMPDSAVKRALRDFNLPKGKLILVSIGKAGYRMAKCAAEILGDKVTRGAVITKYGHSEGEIPGIKIFEAAHPVPDLAGVCATEQVLSMTEGLGADDTVLFLVSGGGSALFESSYCSLDELKYITEKLLACGADISEINTVRKHLSRVKGGRFAEHVYPAKIFAVVLSDVLGDRLDTIASGPACADISTADEAVGILNKYGISVSEDIIEILSKETPKEIKNAEHTVSGSVRELCRAAMETAEQLGYRTQIIGDAENGVAREVGKRLAALALEHEDTDENLAYIIGGETVVHLLGSGLGGRNQEIALAAAPIISGKNNIVVFSVGSDGTDGPTDAAGGIADGCTLERMKLASVDPVKALDNNDSYHALKSAGALIITGPTGTNVNDVAVALVRRKSDTPRRFANLERALNKNKSKV